MSPIFNCPAQSHAEGASGLLGLVKILLMCEDSLLYPNYDFRDTAHDVLKRGSVSIVKQCQHWKPGVCTLSNFGFGGANTFAIIVPLGTTAKSKVESTGSTNSASISPGFQHEEDIIPFVCSQPTTDLGLTNGAMSTYSKFYSMQRKLGNHDRFKFEFVNGQWTEKSPLVFVLGGQGSQWKFMGQDLMKNNKIFRSTIERLEQDSEIPLVSLYEDGSQWMKKSHTAIGVVSFQLGIIALLAHHNIRPDFFLGHSMGETSCAYLAGMQSEAEVLRVARIRSEFSSMIDKNARLDIYPLDADENGEKSFIPHSQYHVRKVPLSAPKNRNVVKSFSMNGKMAVVGMSLGELESLIVRLRLEQTCVACNNAPRGQTVSGPTHEVDNLLDKILETSPGTFISVLDTDETAYHAPYIEVFGDYLRQEFGVVEEQSLPSSWISTSRSQIFGTEYLVQNIVGKVHFQQAIELLPKFATVIEIGPSSSLLSQVKRTRQDLNLVRFIEKGKDDIPNNTLHTLKQRFSSQQSKSTKINNKVSEVLEKSRTREKCPQLHYSERYPKLWGSQSFSIPTWREFEYNNEKVKESSSQGQTIVRYDLSKLPWSSITEHIIRGKNLFPAAGFIHALWSAHGFEKDMEFTNFKVHSPLVIPPKELTIVAISITRTGQYCELRNAADEVCHASAYVRKVLPTTKRITEDQNPGTLNGVESKHFYPHIRRKGYSYGPAYRLLDNVTTKAAILKKKPRDWITYIDSCIHLSLFESESFFYPSGFDRVVLWDNRIDEVSMWVQRKSEDTLGNSTFMIEGLRKDFEPPPMKKKLSIFEEKFIPYNESDAVEDPSLIAALIVRESYKIFVDEPVQSSYLQNIVTKIRACPMVEEIKESSVVISDRLIPEQFNLLLTCNEVAFASRNKHCIIARWGNVCLLKNNIDCHSHPNIVQSWSKVPAAGSVVWVGEGASGAIASLSREREEQKIQSYEGKSNEFLTQYLQKGMKFNFINDQNVHGCWVDVESSDHEKTTDKRTSNFTLQIDKPGNLESFYWCPIDVTGLTAKVTVSTLNFRFVLRALGKLKEKDLSLGTEFSGFDIVSGRRLFGVAKDAMGTHVLPGYAFPTPANFTDEEAASIPIVYLTVYYAFFKKANLKKGQTVLIHAGAGGVGMAAIAVAKSRGLVVYTTCSSGKRRFLKERFGLHDDQIGDSRSDGFVDTVLKGTNERGVDLVLNHLSGELQVASLRCIAAGGDFCEIGKVDIVQSNGINQRLMANNVSFHVIDLIPLLRDPNNHPMWDEFLKEGFLRGEIVPLPTTPFRAENVKDAFRFMSLGKHIGKIVVTSYDSVKVAVEPSFMSLRGQRHMITGGLGGLGLALAYRLAIANCEELILIGRSGVTNKFQELQIKKMEGLGCKVTILQKDITTIDNSVATPNCIWHVATVYNDVTFDKMTEDVWNSVVRTKVQGYQQLRKCWPEVQIVAISSVIAYYGGAMQTNYGYSNAYLDSAGRKDLKTLSIRLGGLEDVGFVTKSEVHETVFDNLKFHQMSVGDVLDHLFKITNKHQSGVYGIYMMKSERKLTTKVFETDYTIDDAKQLVATIMGGKPSDYDSNTVLMEAGFDSLSKIEVVNHVHEMTGSKVFKPDFINETFRITDIVSFVNKDRKRSRGKVSSGSEKTETQKKNSKLNQQSSTNANEEPTPIPHLEHGLNNGTSNKILSTFTERRKPLDHQPQLKNTERKSESSFWEVQVEPRSINFEMIQKALGEESIIVFRQCDEKIFNHGAPIDSDKNWVKKYLDDYVRLFNAFSQSNAIIVVVVEGEVRGGGMIFPAMADICVATKDATFGLPEIHRGTVPAVVSRALKERLGTTATRRLSLTGQIISVEKALAMSLVDELIEESELNRYLENLLRRWKPRVKAAHFIKRELLPRNDGSVAAVGTTAGAWMKQQFGRSVLDSRDVLHVSIDNKVATLTMCDELMKNTASFEMAHAFRSAIPKILQAEVSVIILASSLPNFHVGFNPSTVHQYASRPIHEVAADMVEMSKGFVEVATLGIPIIAVLNGKVMGGGIPLAMWSDYRIVTSDVDFHLGNLSRGVSPCGQLTKLLNEHFPPAEVMKHYLGNTHWYAKDLQRFGFASYVLQTRNAALIEARRLAAFIANKPARAIRDTIGLMKATYINEVAREEAWLMAEKLTQNDEAFMQKDHGSFRVSEQSISLNENNKLVNEHSSAIHYDAVGIVGIECYTPGFCIDGDTLENNKIPAKSMNRQEAIGVWDGQEDAISMAMNAVSMLFEKHVKDLKSVGRIEVGTESNVDMAKSIKSYIMDLMPHDHVDVEGVDNTNACYGGAAALINTLAYCRETGRYGVVIATDTTDMDFVDSAWRGASAVAMLIGPQPWIELHPERASYFKNRHDFLKPRYSPQVSPFVQKKASTMNYIEALDSTLNKMKSAHNIDPAKFDALVIHGGMCVTFHKLVEKHLLRQFGPNKEWQTNFELMTKFASQMGGLCTASMFVNLLSLLHGYGNMDKSDISPLDHIGLFAYGSGSAGTLFHATIHHHRAHTIDLDFILRQREKVNIETLGAIANDYSSKKINTSLPRKRKVFYCDTSRKSNIIREYFQEGMPSTRPKLHESFMKSSNDVPTKKCEEEQKDTEKTKQDIEWDFSQLLTSICFFVGIAWWVCSAFIFEPDEAIKSIVASAIVFVLCFGIHVGILSLNQNEIRIINPLSCAHYTQACMTYLAYISLYIASPDSFHKYWFMIVFGWLSYISCAMIVSWSDVDYNQRLFWIFHHFFSFILLGSRPMLTTSDDWDSTSIKCCFIYASAQLWSASLNLYRNYFGNGRFTWRQVLQLRTIAFVTEKSQQGYALGLLLVSKSIGAKTFWPILLVIVFMGGVEFYFQLKTLLQQYKSLKISTKNKKDV